MEAYETQAKLFKALMHPARLAILDILREGEHCVCHMEAVLGYRQAYISQQLMVLREAGLVQDRREGWNIFYRVTNPEVFAIMDIAARLSGKEAWPRFVHLTPKVCTCPKCSLLAQTA
jgi:ArsR family transcriptional regulator